ncbi:hypothetical protein Tco_1273096 [Tanacetum coccineum]
MVEYSSYTYQQQGSVHYSKSCKSSIRRTSVDDAWSSGSHFFDSSILLLSPGIAVQLRIMRLSFAWSAGNTSITPDSVHAGGRVHYSTPDRFIQIVASIEQTNDLDDITLDEITGKLKAFEKRITLKVDNISAIALVWNPVFHGRSKHIDIRYHFIREYVENGHINVEHVSGELQKADILTKALPRLKFVTMRQMLGVQDLGRSNDQD